MDKELEIRQAKALTNARYDYTELQQDLFFFIISKLHPDNKDVYLLSIKELSGLTGSRYTATNLEKATGDMGSRVFNVPTEKGTGYEQIWMFQGVKYLQGQRILRFQLTKPILPYLFDLKNNFTSYELAAALRLNSKYAKRIYPICSQWKDLGETKKFDLQDFKKVLGLIDDDGERMKQIIDLRTNVLDVAVKQINEHTELHISYNLEKVGRSFKNIVFTVKTQALAETIPFDLVATTTPLPGTQQHLIDNAARVLDELRIIDAKHRRAILNSPEYIAKTNRFNHDLKTGKVKADRNPGGLLLIQLGLVKAKAAKKPA